MNEGAGQEKQHSREDDMTALFANLVMQQANMAMLLMGKVAHPETGKAVKDLQAAGLFIDQIEMLEVKTRGNLRPEEQHLLQQTLMSLRMAYVEATEEQTGKPAEAGSAPGAQSSTLNAEASKDNEEESRKKFTKKY